MMYLYIGYELGMIKHIYTSDKKLDLSVKYFECQTMNEVIYHLERDERTKQDILRSINDKDTLIFEGWEVVISHKVLVNFYGGKTQIWIENEKGELELL